MYKRQVVKPADQMGNVLVQVKKEKRMVNYKRLKLRVKADRLYPEDYDFSIIFDSVENRKARHAMERKFQDGSCLLYTSPPKGDCCQPPYTGSGPNRPKPCNPGEFPG